MKSCTLSITAARSDIPFLPYTVPHLVRSCGDVFSERVLVVDVAPLRGTFQHRPGVGTLEALLDICADLKNAGWIDRIEPVDYAPPIQEKIKRKYFGRSFSYTHDLRGAFVYGLLFSFEVAQSDYVLHFDSDMLLHQDSGFNWVSEAIRLSEEYDDLMFITPLSGPPAPNGALQQREVAYKADPRGVYLIDFVTSRKFVFSKNKLGRLLPFSNYWVSTKRRLYSWLNGKSPLQVMEIVMRNSFRVNHVYRADLASPSAWTLHTPDHGPRFISALPEIIRRIEAGEYPPVQAGDYDLRLEHWL